MKNKLMLLLTFFIGILVLTGCDINYTLKISDEDVYTEKIKLTFATELCYSSNESNPPSSCKVYLNNMKNSIVSYYGLQNYVVNVEEENETTTATFETTYDTLSEFKNSNIYKLFFIEKNIEDNIFKYSKIMLIPKYFQVYNIPASEIKIFNVVINSSKRLVDTNASKENNSDGEYSWNLNNLDVDDVRFTITNKKTNNDSIFNKIKNSNKAKKESKVEQNFDPFLLLVVISLAVLLVAVIAILFVRKIKESKRL